MTRITNFDGSEEWINFNLVIRISPLYALINSSDEESKKEVISWIVTFVDGGVMRISTDEYKRLVEAQVFL